MKISDLQDRQQVPEISVRIIFDNTQVQEFTGKDGVMKKVKPVIVADIDTEKGPTAYLDLVNENIKLFKHMDKMKLINGFSKLIQSPTKKQYRIVNVIKMERLE